MSEQYPLNQVESDIKPEDFPEESVWFELVKYCGPASVIILSKYKEEVGEKLAIRDYSGFVRKAQKRGFRNRLKKESMNR